MDSEQIMVLITAAGGASIGSCAGVLLMGRLARARRERIEAVFADWLTARRSHSRASVSFVAAFKSLAAEGRHSPLMALRLSEAQRARADWVDSVKMLEGAESRLLAMAPHATMNLRPFQPTSAGALRLAIDGDPVEFDKLRLNLLNTDREARDLMTGALADQQVHSEVLNTLRFAYRRGAQGVEELVDKWAGPSGTDRRRSV